MNKVSVSSFIAFVTWLTIIGGISMMPGGYCQTPQAVDNRQLEISSTITGAVEQARTLYILPWQAQVAVITLPGADLPQNAVNWQPLDRQQFLRFISSNPSAISLNISTTNNTQQED